MIQRHRHKIVLLILGIISIAFGLLASPADLLIDRLILGGAMFLGLAYVYFIFVASLWFRKKQEADRAYDPRVELKRRQEAARRAQDALKPPAEAPP